MATTPALADPAFHILLLASVLAPHDPAGHWEPSLQMTALLRGPSLVRKLGGKEIHNKARKAPGVEKLRDRSREGDREAARARNDSVAQELYGSPSLQSPGWGVAKAAAGPKVPIAPSRAHSPPPPSFPFPR